MVQHRSVSKRFEETMPISHQFMGASEKEGGVALAFPPRRPECFGLSLYPERLEKVASQFGKPNA